MDFEVTSKVTAVTVYAQQARVTVKGIASLPTGTHRLVVGDLPLTLQTDSVRAGGQGTADVRVLGVDVRRRLLDGAVRGVHQSLRGARSDVCRLRANILKFVKLLKTISDLWEPSNRAVR